jgi:lysophospholipase-2
MSASHHVVNPIAQHTHTIILLHGRGSNGMEFANEFLESQDTQDQYLPIRFPSIRWVFPCAQMRWAGSEQETMSQWFEMASVQQPHQQKDTQKQGISESVQQVLDLIKDEALFNHIGMKRIFLGGISQGCATAIIALICSGVQLAGFIGLSSWLPFSEEIARLRQDSPANMRHEVRALIGLIKDETEHPVTYSTPVLLEHCLDDFVIAIESGKDLEEQLRALGMQVAMNTYDSGGHWVNEPLGIDNLVNFIEQNFDIIGC